MTAVTISNLSSASTLSGAEVLPVVQSGVTVKATVTQLRTGLADSTHAHTIADSTGLQAALDAKAAASHTHAVADSTGLQAALDVKLTQGKHTLAVLFPGNFKAKSSGGARAGTYENTTASYDDRLDVLDFAVSEVGYARLAVPKSMDAAAGISFDARVMLPSASVGQVGKLTLKARWLRHDDDVTAIAWGTGQTTTVTATGTATDVVASGESAAIIPGGTYAEGCELALRLERDATGNTASGDLRLRTLRLFYSVNAGNDA